MTFSRGNLLARQAKNMDIHATNMRETKLVQLLLRIPEDQRKQFARYVQAEYFNAVPRLGRLLEVLEQHLLRYKLRELSESEAYALIFPHQTYDQNRLRKDCSALLKLLLQFLAQAEFEEADHLQAVLRLRSLRMMRRSGPPSDVPAAPELRSDDESDMA